MRESGLRPLKGAAGCLRSRSRAAERHASEGHGHPGKHAMHACFVSADCSYIDVLGHMSTC